MSIDIASIRDDYSAPGLMEKDMAADPLKQFERWMDDAISANLDQPNTMTLATATPKGVPSARIVLLKEVNERGFVFFTNYRSQKARELEDNPLAALVFFWLPLHRQVRVEGYVDRVSNDVSDAYFESRPLGSQIGAWASPQSDVIASRAILESAYADIEKRYEKEDVPRPPHWGGYCLVPHAIEFWQGQPSRLHDRLQYRKEKEGNWILERLAP